MLNVLFRNSHWQFLPTPSPRLPISCQVQLFPFLLIIILITCSTSALVIAVTSSPFLVAAIFFICYSPHSHTSGNRPRATHSILQYIFTIHQHTRSFIGDTLYESLFECQQFRGKSISPHPPSKDWCRYCEKHCRKTRLFCFSRYLSTKPSSCSNYHL